MSASGAGGAGAGATSAPAAVELDKTTEQFFGYVDEHVDDYVSRLAECVAIRGVSADPALRPEVVKTVKWAAAKLTELGAEVELRELGEQTLPDGSKIPLPPCIFANYGSDASKKTLFVYGHLDVQPADAKDWNTDPWVLTDIDGVMYGRGTTGAYRAPRTRFCCLCHPLGLCFPHPSPSTTSRMQMTRVPFWAGFG